MISDVEAFLSGGKWLAEAGSSSGRAGGGATIRRACGIRGFASAIAPTCRNGAYCGTMSS